VVVVVVVGSELVEVVDGVVEPVVVESEVGDEVAVEVVEVAGASFAELVAGHPVVPVVPAVVVAGVEPASTVESVWVWVRPVGTFGAVFVPVFKAVVPVCLASVFGCDLLCWAAVFAFFACLCGCVTAAVRCSIVARTAGVVVTALAIVSGLGTDAIWLTGAAE
jgi:hypothetical protein